MFLPNYKTPIDLIHEDEIKTFKQKYIEANSTQIITDPFVDGNVLFKVPYNRSSIKTLIEEGYRFPVKDTAENTDFFRDQVIFNAVTANILDIKLNASFKDCIAYIANIRKKAGRNLYGVLLRDTKKKSVIINPLHPLTALSILNDQEYLETAKFNLIAYFYPNRQEMDRKYSTNQADPEKIQKSINALIQLFGTRLSTEVRVDSIEEQRNGEYKITYRTKRHKDEVSNASHYLVTHQLVTKGVICPYYGTSLITLPTSGSSKGTPLSPLTSANISSSGSFSGHDGSVCCGSQNNKTLEGLRTLTHSNLSSAYCSRNFAPGSLMYIDACINKTFEIYNRAGIIDSLNDLIIDINTLEAKFTPEELACKNINEFRQLHKDSSLPEVIARFKDLRKEQLNAKNTESNNEERNSTQESNNNEEHIENPDFTAAETTNSEDNQEHINVPAETDVT